MVSAEEQLDEKLEVSHLVVNLRTKDRGEGDRGDR